MHGQSRRGGAGAANAKQHPRAQGPAHQGPAEQYQIHSVPASAREGDVSEPPDGSGVAQGMPVVREGSESPVVARPAYTADQDPNSYDVSGKA